ncbi:MAG: bifunctional phosphoribosyl-AMP cyclohydrolase/phosphoribosyl-ATP diphosphatase HisIE [Armatimonadota bacterium]|nr:bifunctional phosphoribosyl-AMP cyclohydrolase/phosphoribosyl-ATP diphosphatase HisIE [Armatimonadota bacterium]MDR7532853.1 bifunctional phosphoribosyl-AMP cyclohydrolase/phosphoribosyl-ATP diphosphatase HisIE [Armatimonadota bacterium]
MRGAGDHPPRAARPAPDAVQAALRWEAGPLPCIVQDARSGTVLMLAWMTREAFERTLATGQAWFWSRARQALWRKGETSGHTQRVVRVAVDCDGDAVLLQVVPQGPACHTGHASCFYRDGGGAEQPEAGPVLARLEAVVAQRRRTMPAGSYTAQLLAGGVEVTGAKVLEEAGEVVRAAREETTDRVAEEVADLIYHLLVLLAARGMPLARALDVLAARGA